MAQGFARVAAAPEFIYVLGFSPQGLKIESYLLLDEILAGYFVREDFDLYVTRFRRNPLTPLNRR
jgi:hypothetical protein